MFQQMGFGVGVALLLDATLIRMIVVPAAMSLLGSWNWYLPSWLGWLPELHVEGDPDVSTPAGPPSTQDRLPVLMGAAIAAPRGADDDD
jgi:RND superfamily putative drug exporter